MLAAALTTFPNTTIIFPGPAWKPLRWGQWRIWRENGGVWVALLRGTYLYPSRATQSTVRYSWLHWCLQFRSAHLITTERTRQYNKPVCNILHCCGCVASKGREMQLCLKQAKTSFSGGLLPWHGLPLLKSLLVWLWRSHERSVWHGTLPVHPFDLCSFGGGTEQLVASSQRLISYYSGDLSPLTWPAQTAEDFTLGSHNCRKKAGIDYIQ